MIPPCCVFCFVIVLLYTIAQHCQHFNKYFYTLLNIFILYCIIQLGGALYEQ
nr:MAG TPA: hypothetical protein [Caudoviricetes sp.]